MVAIGLTVPLQIGLLVAGLDVFPGKLAELLFLTGTATLITPWIGGRGAVRRLFGGLIQWRFGVGRWSMIVLAMPTLTVAVAAVTGTLHSPDHGWVRGKGSPTCCFSLLILLTASLWEETAWSGFVQRRLINRRGLLVGSLLTAIPFGLIHLPLAFEGDGWAGTTWHEAFVNWAFLLGALPFLRYLAGVLLVDTRGSVLAVAVLHASFNASGACPSSPDGLAVRSRAPAILTALVVVHRRLRGASLDRRVPSTSAPDSLSAPRWTRGPVLTAISPVVTRARPAGGGTPSPSTPVALESAAFSRGLDQPAPVRRGLPRAPSSSSAAARPAMPHPSPGHPPAGAPTVPAGQHEIGNQDEAQPSQPGQPQSHDRRAGPNNLPLSDAAASDSALLRIGAVAGITGVLLQVAMDQMHPAHADPNDSRAAFTEYSHYGLWTVVHIGQFLGTLLLVIALLALARGLSRQRGLAGALAMLGAVTAIIVAAVFTVQMAVDGVALRSAIDTWTSAAAGPERPPPSRSPTACAASRRDSVASSTSTTESL